MDECIYESSKKRSPTLSEGKKSTLSHLKCIYTNVCKMDNKQEELEPCAQCEGCQRDARGMPETSWENSLDEATTMDGYKYFQKDKKGRRGGGVALYVTDIFACIEESCGDRAVLFN